MCTLTLALELTVLFGDIKERTVSASEEYKFGANLANALA